MEIDPIAATIGVVGTIIAAFVVHLLIKVRDKKNNFIAVASEAAKPFIEAKSILGLRTRGLDDRCYPKDVFIRMYSAQKTSIQTMLPALPCGQRRRLKAAWDEYEQRINNENPSTWFSVDNLFKQDDDINQTRQDLLMRIDSIMCYFDYHNVFSVFKVCHRNNE